MKIWIPFFVLLLLVLAWTSLLFRYESHARTTPNGIQFWQSDRRTGCANLYYKEKSGDYILLYCPDGKVTENNSKRIGAEFIGYIT